MNARHVLIATLAIVTLAVFAAVIIHRFDRRARAAQALAAASRLDAMRASSTSVEHGATSDEKDSPELPPAPSRDLVERDANAAAAAWWARAERVMAAKNAQRFGVAAARLLELPPDQAWPGLVELAEAGDESAANAAALIVMDCRGMETSSAHAEPARSAASRIYPKLSQRWVPFVEALRDQEDRTRKVRAQHCVGIGIDEMLDFGEMALDRFLGPDASAQARADIANDTEDRAQAIADLRQLDAENSDAHVQLLLGDRLIQSHDVGEREEGRALLERLAPDDPRTAYFLGACLAEGCGDKPIDPDAANEWLTLAAGAGDRFALTLLGNRLDASGDAAVAWAWSLYQLDLALAGCLDDYFPQSWSVGQAANIEAMRAAALSAEQHNAGLAAYYGISGRWERSAKERLGCAQ